MLTYFLQVNLCWLVFYGLYYALLSRETFFRLNRIYLIISLLCGLVIPLSIMSISVEPSHPAVVILQPLVISAAAFELNVQAVETTWSIWLILKIHYWVGFCILTLRLLMGLFKIFFIYKKAEIVKSEGYKVAFTNTITTPFSFLNTVFINPNQFNSIDYQQVMQHEKAHIQQKHTLDILFLELLTICFWCSPLIYFYKKSLINVHEYLADEAVLKTTSTPQYGKLLISQVQPYTQFKLANNFLSQLKKRIEMMTKNRSSKKARLKYALFLPILVLVGSYIVACSKDAKNETIEKQVDVLPEFKGGQEALFKYLRENIKYPKEATESNSEGTSYIGFVVEKDGSITNINIKKTAQPRSIDTIQQIDPKTYETTTKIVANNGSNILDNEATRVVQSMPKWISGKKGGKDVRTEFVLPVKFQMEPKPTYRIGGATGLKADTIIIVDPATGKSSKQVIMMDEKGGLKAQ